MRLQLLGAIMCLLALFMLLLIQANILTQGRGALVVLIFLSLAALVLNACAVARLQPYSEPLLSEVTEL